MNSPAERAAALYTITISQFALAFMLSAVAVAVPTLGHEFGANAALLGLVESGYIASVAALLFPLNRLADKIGRPPTFALGLSIFTAMSFVLPLAGSIEQFIGLRVLQGAGGAMMITTGLAIIADIYPASGRAKAMGIATAGIYLGLSAGPWAGGLVTSHFSWRWIFYGGAIPCAIGLLLTLNTMPIRPVVRRGVTFDPLGALLGGAGMILLSLGSSRLNDSLGQVLMTASVLCLVGFVLWEKRAKAPLLDMGLFRSNRAFSYGSAVQFISYAGTFGITFLVSLYLQIVQGMPPSQAGTILLAQPVMQVLFSLISGTWCERWNPQAVATLGMSAALASMAGAVFLGPDTAIWHTMAVLGLCGGGNAIFATANMSVIMGAVDREHYGVASAVVASMRTTGMTVSLVLISTVFAVFIGPVVLDAGSAGPLVKAMRISLIIFTLFGAAGVVMCLKATSPRKARTAEEEANMPMAGKTILQPGMAKPESKK